MIKFEKRSLKTEIRNPLLNFAIDKQEIELRKDPLTGMFCRININRSKRVHPGLAEPDSVKQVIEKSKPKCPFCSVNIFKVTPKFVGMKERFILGNSVIVPNLYPFGTFHGVAVLSPKHHYLKLDEISPKLLYESLENIIDFFKVANKKKPRFKYHSINFNYMPPAAASIIHPHFQIILDDKPTRMTDLLIKKSSEYFKRAKSNFWSDLVKTEKKKKERFIGETGNFSWLADFAPIRNNQVSGVCKGISNFSQMKTSQIRDLANGLSKIFKRLWDNKVRTLNLTIYSGPADKDISDYFLLNLKLISRPVLAQYYVSDIGFMEYMHQEPVVETLPENVAKSLRLG
ncbi:MAG TPA: hypothetical protein VJ343_01305 [archaeon]|nr:hypothetical protein [archaeon]